MRKALQFVLCGFLLFAFFCPVLCLANAVDAQQHSCCDKGAAPTGKSNCDHLTSSQKADLVVVDSIAPPAVFWLLNPLTIAYVVPARTNTLLQPPPILPPLVLRI